LITYTRAHVRMPESSVINLKNCSYRITADIEVASATPSGVVVCQGGNMAGWSLYLAPSGVPEFHYNLFGHTHTIVRAKSPLTVGRHSLEVNFAYDGGFGAGGVLALAVDDVAVDAVRLENTVPLVYSMSGETFDVGTDTGSPVGKYPHDFTFTDTIHTVTLERLDEPSAEVKELIREGEFRASLSTQ